MLPPEVLRAIFITVIAAPASTTPDGLSPVTKTMQDNRAADMVSGATWHERQASFAANPAAGVPGR
jgi:hypothetical protein